MAAEELRLPGLERAQRIGAGGFGTVYRAWQPEFGRWVAVKVLAGTLADADEQRRFERERMASGSLSAHPSIVTVHAHGVTEDGRPYIVMELLEGGSLADRLRDGRLEPSEVIEVGVALAGALATAHEAGVLHRDVKPENVLFSGYGQPALADFGIARMPGVTATRSGVITASLSHAPPEVLGGEAPDERADVYGLASTLWTAAVGEPPFSRGLDEPIAALVARIATAAPPDAAEHGVPAELAALLARGLAKDPDERPATATLFGQQLRELQADLGLPATPLLTGAIPAVPEATATTAAPDEVTRPRGPAPNAEPRGTGRRRTLVALAIALALVGTAGAWAMTSSGRGVDVEVADAAGDPTDGSAPATGTPRPSSSASAQTDAATASPSPEEEATELLGDGTGFGGGSVDHFGGSGGDSGGGNPGGTSTGGGGSNDSGGSGSTGGSTNGGGTDGGGTDGGGTDGGGTDGGGTDGGTTDSRDPSPTNSPTSTVSPKPSPSPSPSATPKANQAPVARYVTRVASGTDTVTFDASTSSDPDGDSLSYRWTFNDGTAAKTGKVVTHTFTSKADNTSSVWTVTLEVTDPAGAKATATVPTTVTMPNLYNMNSEDAFQAARGAGLKPFYSPAWNDTVSFGSYRIWSQWPGSGTSVAGHANVRIVVWEQDTCAANPDETYAHWWCYEEPPPSPTLDRSYF